MEPLDYADLAGADPFNSNGSRPEVGITRTSA
jgi:hypothetical protein